MDADFLDLNLRILHPLLLCPRVAIPLDPDEAAIQFRSVIKCRRRADAPALLPCPTYQCPATGRSVATPKDAVIASTPTVQVMLPSMSR